MNNKGFFALDTIAALGISAILIMITASITLTAPQIFQENKTLYESLQLIENHLDELYNADWSALQTQTLSRDVTCSYEVITTEYDTEQLKVYVSVNGKTYEFLIERSVYD